MLAQLTRKEQDLSAVTPEYLHNDQLGTVSFTSTPMVWGNKVRTDPYGNRFDPTKAPRLDTPTPAGLVGITRGYTGHEIEVEDLGVINMKGRIFDPINGRFNSPDPLVQAPQFSQSYNRMEAGLLEWSRTQAAQNFANKRRELSVDPRLEIRDGQLRFDGKRVKPATRSPSEGNVERCSLGGWIVVGLGRTSETDQQASLEPPFFASELIVFSTRTLRASVRYLASAPGGNSNHEAKPNGTALMPDRFERSRMI